MTRPAQSFALAALTTLVTSSVVAAQTVPAVPTAPTAPTVPTAPTAPAVPIVPNKSGTTFTPFPTTNIQVDPNLTNVNKADYVLGPGDQLQLNMYGQADLFTGPSTVLVDGTISLPFIGRVPVAGRTVQEVEFTVTDLYKRYFKRPYVTIVLAKPRQLTLAVSGEVVKPGTYPFTGADQIPTVSQLLKLSGGVTPSADLRSVQVRRSKFGKSGVYENISVNLMKLIQEGDISQDIRMRDGDIVFVPVAARPSLADFAAAADSSFAATNTEPLNIAIIGEVFRPGPYTVQASNSVIGAAGSQGTQTGANGKNLPTVSQAVQLAGGIKPEADVRKVQVRRVTRTGNEQLLSVDLWKMLVEGDIRQDIPLQQGDTVVISKSAIPLTAEEQQFLSNATLSPATIDVNVVGEVSKPGTVKIKPNTPLNTAVLAAGGFDNRRANKSTVRLIRLNPDGTVSDRKIKLAFNAAVNEDTNPPLRNNDVVMVGRSGLAAFGDATGNILGSVTGPLSILSIFGI
jgi:polysaccharide biosynthesis/export protein